MYLTRFEFNRTRRGAQRLLASAQRIHAVVLGSFPANALDQGRVLWRIDQVENNRRHLYITSPERPDLTGLVEEAGWPSADAGWVTTDYSGFLAALENGQSWRFRLTANPVVSKRADCGTRGRPIGLTEAGQLEWLASRGPKMGVQVDPASTMITRRETVTFNRGGEGAGRRVTLSTAQYDGVLSVTEPVALRQTLTDGVGRAKGYGCGLMTLAPPR